CVVALQCTKKETADIEEVNPPQEKALGDKTVDSTLYAPLEILELGDGSKASGGLAFSKHSGGFQLAGELVGSVATLALVPPEKHWDISAYTYLRIDFTNNGSGLVWMNGRLDNKGARGYANSTASLAFALPGERVTLGFPYPRTKDQNDAPSLYDTHSGKPNGHRTHWKRFDPKLVTACRLQIQSSSPDVSLGDIQMHLAHEYGVAANRKRMQLPYLDKFGQVRNEEWLGKLHDEKELLTRRDREERDRDNGPVSFNKYGGWVNGPKLKATGYFYTTKHHGKWWLVDPSGCLFFSQGINTVGYFASTPIGDADRKSLFEWLPATGDPMRKVVITSKKKWKPKISFIRANVYRTFGENWEKPALERIHHRMRHWGMNTLGAWSDRALFSGSANGVKTPYTEILHIWRKHATRITEDTPDPYSEDFDEIVRKGLQKIVAERGHDPWCIGVFVDNETDWPKNLVELVFAKGANQSAKVVFIDHLKKKYGSVAKLNAAWKTKFASWDAMLPAVILPQTASRKSDYDVLYAMLADEYYRICHDEMRRVMPNHLYLGSRIHTCPEWVKRACAKYTDVYSSNHYDALPGRAGLPADVDKPVLISEYHFAAPDRGVPGVGLFPVGDQCQRARAFAAYSLDGILDPNIVGLHWFTYADQSAAGRPYENYQIGFVDVTDTPYPMITEMARKLSDMMYTTRSGKSNELLESLYQLIKA
ncbi:MAG: beta-galactosidase, partial [Verrucomicrobiae bacterium]|nr:beta-galactosidase [Verrucomicrobiae bacterium]NNJ87318.1 hypothetical protein [Akkermansiaceae bacterium]